MVGRSEKRVKLEPGLLGLTSRAENQQQPTPRTMPGTPSSGRYLREASASASPSPGPNSLEEREEDEERFGEMDEMGFSFGMGGEDALPGMPMCAPFSGSEYAMGAGFGVGGMGMQMGMGDMYEGLWQGHGNSGHGGSGTGGSGMREGGVHVKTEPRWEEAYRHI